MKDQELELQVAPMSNDTMEYLNVLFGVCRKHPQPLPEHLSAGRGGETEQDGRNAVWKEVGYGIAI